MKVRDKALTPQIAYYATKAVVEAIANPEFGMEAISTDTLEKGTYNGSAWEWADFTLSFPLVASLGGTGIANGASASLTLPNVALTLAAAGAYTLTIPATGTAALLGTANVFTAVQSFPDGSAASPAVKGANATTTGIIFNPSGNLNRLGFVTNGVLRLEINQSGTFSFFGSSLLTLGAYGSPSSNTRLIFDSGATGRIAFSTPTYNPIMFMRDTGHVSVSNSATFAELSGGGKFQVAGAADEIQVAIRAHSTQTANIWEVQKSDATIYTKVDGTGRLGIGMGATALTAKVHIGAGTATAGTAPLKFTSGTALTTPEAGVLEYHNDRLHITNVASRRVIDRTSDVITSTTTVTNTVTETAIYTGSIVANEFKVGNLIKVRARGVLTNATAADDITVNIYIGSTLVETFTPAIGVVTAAPWDAVFELCVRSVGVTGSVAFHGEVFLNGSNDEANSIQTIDTTAAENLTVKVQWANAKVGNTISIYQGYLEIKN